MSASLLVLGWLGGVSAAEEPAPSPAAPALEEDPAVPPPSGVTQVLAQGVVVDWTAMELQVHTVTRGSPIQSIEAVEQLGRREVDAAINQSAPKLRVTMDGRVSDLLADDRLGAAVQSRLSRWEVVEAVYGTSRTVELTATLSLQELLKPWALQIARAGAAPPADPAAPSGLLVDARGTGAEPAYAIRLLGPDGAVLYAGELYEEEAVTMAPYLFVPDPSHPQAARAGAAPTIVRGVSAKGTDVVLDGEGASRVRELTESLLGRAPVIVVVDGL